MYRKEHDSLGDLSIPAEAYYGINAKRAYDNFQITNTRLDSMLIESLVEVKKAAALANMEIGELDKIIGSAIVKAADEMLEGDFVSDMIVDPIQGGAGTSTNMNINEVLANRAIEILGGNKGEYRIVSPTDHVNKGQSTNDVFPTTGKITFIKLINVLSKTMGELADTFKAKATEFAHIKKMGRTQLSDAVPITVGEEFNAYYTVTKRNIRRLEGMKEELKYINMGGTAIGTGLAAHPKFSKTVRKYLQEISQIELEIAEDLIDNTQNVESFGVLSDCLKTVALNASKIANDIRLLSSGPRTGIGELRIPAKQNGSSIMPGKINPVIPEVVNQCAFLIAGNSVTISMAIEAGQLELNAFEPVIFHKLIESFQVLDNSLETFNVNCIKGIEVNEVRCKELLEKSTYLTTPLASFIGYEEAAEIAKVSLIENKTVREVAREKGISEEVLKKIAL